MFSIRRKKSWREPFADTNGVHGIALAPDIKRGFTSNGKANTVTIFDLASLKTIGTVPTENKPDAIVYDALTKRVFAANGKSNSISVIDAAQGKNVGTIPLDGKPEFAVIDGKERLFVNLENKNQIAVVDTKNLKVITRYDVSSVCEEPSGLAIDSKKERLFAGCGNNEKMAIVDGKSGKIIAAVPIGQRKAMRRLSTAGRAWLSGSNGDGTLTVIGSDGANGYKVEQTVKTMPTARTMALDAASHRIYLVGAEMEPVASGSNARPQAKDGTFTLLTVAP